MQLKTQTQEDNIADIKMKTSNVTKKEIKKVLRTFNTTQIFRVAAKSGIDTNRRKAVMCFIEENAPNKKCFNQAYSLSYGAGDFKNEIRDWSLVNMPITDAIRLAKKQKLQGFSNYSKILIEGNKNIYWASPKYLHQDYNKNIAFKNTKRNREIAEKINNFLNFN